MRALSPSRRGWGPDAAGKVRLAAIVFLATAACHNTYLPSEIEPADLSATVVAGGDRAGQTAAEAPFKRILCFGDSLTTGVTLRMPPGEWLLTPVEGYVPKLALLLAERYGDGFELINAGLPGETTTEGVRRLSSETLLRKPDLVLILEGVVDVNNDNPRFSDTRTNLRDMIRIARGREAHVIIGTIPPLNSEGFRANGPDNVATLNEMIRSLAEREDVRVADHEKAFGSELSHQGPDGLHPNDNGYRVMARTWFDAIVAEAAGPLATLR